MNLEHAVQTIAKRGFTDRQARFLVLVARHSGVCVMRQYSSFAGIVFGQKTRQFFANLIGLGFVSTYDCAHNRGRPSVCDPVPAMSCSYAHELMVGRTGGKDSSLSRIRPKTTADMTSSVDKAPSLCMLRSRRSATAVGSLSAPMNFRLLDDLEIAITL